MGADVATGRKLIFMRRCLYGHYWISLAAALSAYAQAGGKMVAFFWALLLFGGVLSLYNAHRLLGGEGSGAGRFAALSRAAAWQNLYIGGLISLLAFWLLLLRLPALPLVKMSAIAACAWLYVLPFGRFRLRDFPLLKVPYLAIVWALATVWLPNVEISINIWQSIIYIFFLTLVFDVRDLNLDAQEGTITWARLFGTVPTTLFSALGLLLWAVYFSQSLSLLLSGIFSALCVLGLLFSRLRGSDFYYAFALDGQIILQAILLLFWDN